MIGYDLSDLISLVPVRSTFGERKWHKWRVWYELPMDCMDCGRPMDGPGTWQASNGLRFRSFVTCAEAWAWIESGPPTPDAPKNTFASWRALTMDGAK